MMFGNLTAFPSLPEILQTVRQAADALSRMAAAIERIEATCVRLEIQQQILHERMARIEMVQSSGDHWDESSGAAEAMGL